MITISEELVSIASDYNRIFRSDSLWYQTALVSDCIFSIWNSRADLRQCFSPVQDSAPVQVAVQGRTVCKWRIIWCSSSAGRSFQAKSLCLLHGTQSCRRLDELIYVDGKNTFSLIITRKFIQLFLLLYYIILYYIILYYIILYYIILYYIILYYIILYYIILYYIILYYIYYIILYYIIIILYYIILYYIILYYIMLCLAVPMNKCAQEN